MKYRLLIGTHTGPDGKKYQSSIMGKAPRPGFKKGDDIVESDSDLRKVFPGKFELASVIPDQDEMEKEIDRRANILAEQRVKELLAQKSAQRDSDAPVATDAEGRPVPPKAPEAPADGDEGDEAADDEAVSLGEDVSASFPKAVDKELLVFKAGNKYNVATGAAPNKALNEVPLATRGVDELIE